MQRRWVIIGTVLFGVGTLVLLVPPLEPAFGFADSVILLFGIVLTFFSINHAIGTVRRPVSRADPPTPEEFVDLPTPGHSVEAELSVLSKVPNSPEERTQYKDTKAELQSRLKSLAVETLVDEYGVDRERAAELIENGDWTDDPYAVAFFTGSFPESAPFLINVRTVPMERKARHAIDELGALATGEPTLPALEQSPETGETESQPTADRWGDQA